MPGRRRKLGHSWLPNGVVHKSPGHMALIRKERRVAKAEQGKADSIEGGAALGEAWSRAVGLRAGDEVPIGEDDDSAVYPNAWRPRRMMKVGWKEVANKHSHGRGVRGVGETRRGIDAVTSLATIARKASIAAFHGWLDAFPGKVMHVERHHDPTQLRLTFGSLEAVLHPGAKYTVPDESTPGRYKMVGWTEFHQRYPKAKPSRGYVEFFAQTLECHTVYPITKIEDSRTLFYHRVF